ncbi:hypothetical protein [Bradyrhizobium aeschynomenes]|uniref:hypothetical protein n=1 Tax=Bradyrhizobium aeschynomenes TaxID=2734909 RepID=UPI0015519764|nr:hypothetical protein [Bradyrhizobium aeschynomenes]NPV19769.1 hypothetical protein [Bradyrhizobium aeschynomenes]
MFRRNDITFGVAAVGLLLSASMASAAAPVVFDGWRYIAGPNDLHIFICERADCVPGSRLVCHIMAHGSALPPGILRKWDGMAAELAGEPAKTSPTLSLDLAGGSLLIDTADETRSYRAFSIVNSATSRFILISSSNDESASHANLARFEKALQETSK